MEDIYEIEDTENEVGVTFSAMLTWFEIRSHYSNLKTNAEKNVLQNEEKATLWVPQIFFQNKKKRFTNTPETTIFAMRQEDPIQVENDSDDNHDRNIFHDATTFEGETNPLSMNLTTTLRVECTNFLNVFPFGKQVKFPILQKRKTTLKDTALTISLELAAK